MKEKTNNEACNDYFEETLSELESLLPHYFTDIKYRVKSAEKVGVDAWRESLRNVCVCIDYLRDNAKDDVTDEHTIKNFYALAVYALFTYVYTQGYLEDYDSFVTKNVVPLIEEMKDTHARKGHDYNDRERPYNNCRTSELMGIPAWIGVLIRLSDKVERLCAFAQQGKLLVKDESIKDTCIDAANYAVIASILCRETFPKTYAPD